MTDIYLNGKKLKSLSMLVEYEDDTVDPPVDPPVEPPIDPPVEPPIEPPTEDGKYVVTPRLNPFGTAPRRTVALPESVIPAGDYPPKTSTEPWIKVLRQPFLAPQSDSGVGRIGLIAEGLPLRARIVNATTDEIVGELETSGTGTLIWTMFPHKSYASLEAGKLYYLDYSRQPTNISGTVSEPMKLAGTLMDERTQTRP